jgi:hypothetical protein
MTQEQKKLVAEIREANVRAMNQAMLFDDMESQGCAKIIDRCLDTLEADGKCEWTEDADGIWHCNKCECAWAFDCDGPVENKTHFCPECGREITKITPYVSEYEATE